MNDYPALYVFVRSDMQSLGSSSGKMAAHSGHAANAFIHKAYIKPLQAGHAVTSDVVQWASSTPQGFGTQINLKGDWNDIVATVSQATIAGFFADIVVDPTYPYFVDSEIFTLLNPETHSSNPVKLENGKFLCFRREATAAYIFGFKSVLEPFVGGYVLHP